MIDLKYNVFETLLESSSSELGNLESFDESNMINDIIDIFNECDELDIDIPYTPDMVPVFEHSTSTGIYYLVEHENVCKLINYYQNKIGYCDEEIAMEKIAEHHNISLDDMILVMESEETYKRLIANLNERIKREKDPTAKSRLRLSLQNLKDKMNKLRNSDKIKVMKKKNVIK